MNVKKIFIILVVTILSFGASFGISWFVNSKKPLSPENVAQPIQASLETPAVKENNPLQPERAATRSLPERRLLNLIEDARNKVRDCKLREDQLDEYESQLEITKQSLSDDVKKLSNLYDQLSRQVLELKKQQQILDERIVEIKQDESERLKQLASVYDNMDETSSASIFINMITNNQLEDAAKIVFFMSDRKSAKVLAEITNEEPTVARILCTKIKNIKEES